MRALLFAGAIVLGLSVTGNASSLTGESLAFACAGNVPGLKKDRDSDKRVELCNIYINAWDDTVSAFMRTRPFCPPGVTIKEMSVIFFDYLATHKEARDLPAAEAVMQALKDKFPCQSK